MIHIGPVRDLTVRERSEGSDGLALEAFKIVYDDAAAAVLLSQVTGLANRLVALVDDNHPHRSGLFVVRVAVPTETRRLASGNRLIEIDLRLERQPDRVEAAYTLTYRATAPANFHIAAVHGYYGTDFENQTHVADDGGFGMGTTLPIAGPDDAPASIKVGDKAISVLEQVSVQQGVNPAFFDVGATVIDVAPADSGDWFRLTGSVVPDGHDLRISNGYVRVTVVEGQPYVLVDLWNGSVWVNAMRTSFALITEVGRFVRRWSVSRNDNAEVAVRCSLIRYGQIAMWVDLTLGRGSSTATAVASSGFSAIAGNLIAKVYEYDGSNMVTTTTTNGIARSVALDGVSPLLVGDAGVTASTSTDTVTYTTGTARFGLGRNTQKSLDDFRANRQVADRLVL